MKRLLIIAALLLACRSTQPPQQAVQPTQPTAALPAAPTADTLLGQVETLTYHFQTQHQFVCEVNGNHWRCFAPDGLVKLTLFGDPVSEATISIPLDAAASKPSKYVVALLFQTGLDNTAWDWLVSQMQQAEASREFGNRRVTSQMDGEGWLVTVEAVR